MMKNIPLFFCCLVFSGTALADTSGIVASNNQFIFQLISTNVDYKETGNGMLGTQTGILDTESGPVPGFAFSVSSMQGAENIYSQAEFNSSNGNTTYTGAFQGGTFGSVVANSTAALINFSARIGKGFDVQNQYLITPFFELGRHGWNRGVNYGEIYTHNYYGVGVLGQFYPAEKLVLSANALLGGTFGSYIVVHGGPGFTGFSGSLGDSALSRVGVSADYAFTRQFHGNIGFDYTSFSYGISGVYPVVLNGQNAFAWEPDSKTHYTTLKIGLGIAF